MPAVNRQKGRRSTRRPESGPPARHLLPEALVGEAYELILSSQSVGERQPRPWVPGDGNESLVLTHAGLDPHRWWLSQVGLAAPQQGHVTKLAPL